MIQATNPNQPQSGRNLHPRRRARRAAASPLSMDIERERPDPMTDRSSGEGPKDRSTVRAAGVEAELADPDCVVVRSERELELMVAEVLDGAREYPVVCLTSRPGEGVPALAAGAVRGVVGPGIPVYFVGGRRLQLRLTALLPDRLDVHSGAARVWWPGVCRESNPRDHPLIIDRSRMYEARALERLAREFRLVRGAVELTPEQRVVLAERQLEGVRRRNEQLEKDLREYERVVLARERVRASASSEEAVVEGCGEDLRAGAGGGARGLDAEERSGVVVGVVRAGSGDLVGGLHILICREWVGALSPVDRAVHPLGRYVFAREFVKDVERRSVEISVDRIAWVCAMVACGLAPGLHGVDPHPLLVGGGGAQLVREDQAKGWRCSLKRNAYGGPRLHYWVLVNGTIEFAALGYHDGLGRL